MTSYEHIMLSACFGTCMGFLIAMWGFIIKTKIDDFREKRKNRKQVEEETE